jgi:hypothetical protein
LKLGRPSWARRVSRHDPNIWPRLAFGLAFQSNPPRSGGGSLPKRRARRAGRPRCGVRFGGDVGLCRRFALADGRRLARFERRMRLAPHLVLRHFYRRARKGEFAWRPWAHWFAVAALADGVWWGCATIFLVGRGSLDEQLLTTFVAFGVSMGAVTAFGSYLPAFQAIFFPIALLPLAWKPRLRSSGPFATWGWEPRRWPQ